MNSLRLRQWLAGLSQKPFLLEAILVFATLLLYSPVAHHKFLVLDDQPYVTANAHVNTGLTPANVAWAFTTFTESNWHPLTWLSHMTDCRLFGLNSAAHHLVNVGLHVLNILLLFWLLRKATGAVWRSFLVAALFAVHPMNVETVAWVAERKTLLCTLFSLLMIAAYGWYARRPGWKRYLAIMVAFALALLSKPMAVTLPLVTILLDYWPLRRDEDAQGLRRWLALLAEKVPLLLMSAASSAVTIVAARSGGGTMELTFSLPLFDRIENASVSYVAYLEKLFWPARLAIFYPHPAGALPIGNFLASTAILLAITAAAFYFRRTRYLLTGWLLFLVTLVPVIGIVQVGQQSMADRYAYFPYIGLFSVLAWGLGEIAEAIPGGWLVPSLAALCLTASLAIATTQYLPYWQDGVKLLTRARNVASTPNWFIENALGDAMLADNQLDGAYQHYAETSRLRPNNAMIHYDMALILQQRNQLQDALEQYRIAAPGFNGMIAFDSSCHYRMALILQQLNQPKDALEQYRLAVRFTTTDRGVELSSMINSGKILLDFGDTLDAGRVLERALQIDPGNTTALDLRLRMHRNGAPAIGLQN